MGQEFMHDRFDIEDWRSIDGIKTFDIKPIFASLDYSDDRKAEAVGAILPALREDADLRPARIISRMARAADDLRIFDEVKIKDHLGVRELFDPGQPVCT